MIKLLRVDDRLIHGQVALTWTSFLKADTIVVGNDRCAKDAFASMALNLAKPPGVALNIVTKDDAIEFLLNQENSQRKIFVVVESTDDAVYISEKVEEISNVILGGIRKSEEKHQIERQVFLSQHDLDNCDLLEKMGKTVHIQVVPSEKKLNLDDTKHVFNKNR
ncbi:MAG: PTS sugar transporter subunit IIB [Erysipelotrichaceae bacterium]